MNDRRAVIAFILAELFAAGCSPKVDFHYENSKDGKEWLFSTNSTTTTVINGVTKRISFQKRDNAERSIEATGNVTFFQGKPVKWGPDSLIKLREKANGSEMIAELRPDGKVLRLFMKKSGSFQPATADDDLWAANLLAQFKLDDTPPSQRSRQLEKECQAKTLSTQEQIGLIDTIFDKIADASDQKGLLLKLIRRKDFSKQAKFHLIDKLDKIRRESDRKQIEKELLLYE